ncbi:MAG: hypothetical protein AAF664_15675 [Planctomycetota bacterium]
MQRWFFFLRRIGGWQPPAAVTLGDSKNVIVSLFTHNLPGEVRLTNDPSEPLNTGNLALKREHNEPAGISMYAMYFSGDETDATIFGRTHICEWMQRGGKVSVKSLGKSNQLPLGSTTMEVSGSSELITTDAFFGRPLTWQPKNKIGEANVVDQAQRTAYNITINNIRFRAEYAA